MPSLHKGISPTCHILTIQKSNCQKLSPRTKPVFRILTAKSTAHYWRVSSTNAELTHLLYRCGTCWLHPHAHNIHLISCSVVLFVIFLIFYKLFSYLTIFSYISFSFLFHFANCVPCIFCRLVMIHFHCPIFYFILFYSYF